MEVPTLSASRLKLFQSCNRKYWYDYIKKEPYTKHPSAVLGTSLHRTIERLHTNDKILPEIAFSAIYAKETEAEGLPYDTLLWSDGIDIIQKYKVTRTPLVMEEEFTLEYPNKENPVCKFHGFIDQRYEWGFVDLKSNKRKPTQVELDKDLQFIIYAWAFKQITGRDPERCIWYQLRTGKEMYADVVGKTYLVDEVLQQMDMAYFMDEYPRNETFMCRFCPFKEPCLGIPIGVKDV